MLLRNFVSLRSYTRAYAIKSTGDLSYHLSLITDVRCPMSAIYKHLVGCNVIYNYANVILKKMLTHASPAVVVLYSKTFKDK
jgi:hypothetical protein